MFLLFCVYEYVHSIFVQLPLLLYITVYYVLGNITGNIFSSFVFSYAYHFLGLDVHFHTYIFVCILGALGLRIAFDFAQGRKYKTRFLNTVTTFILFIMYTLGVFTYFPTFVFCFTLGFVVVLSFMAYFISNRPPVQMIYDSDRAVNLINYFAKQNGIKSYSVSDIQHSAMRQLRFMQMNYNKVDYKFDKNLAIYYHHVVQVCQFLSSDTGRMGRFAPTELTMFSNTVTPETAKVAENLAKKIKPEAYTCTPPAPIIINSVLKNIDIERSVVCEYCVGGLTTRLQGFCMTTMEGVNKLYIVRHLFGNTEESIKNFKHGLLSVYPKGRRAQSFKLDFSSTVFTDTYVIVPYTGYRSFAQLRFAKNPLQYVGPACITIERGTDGNFILETGIVDNGKHNLNTSNGDCGSPLYATNGELLGLHVASQITTYRSDSLWYRIYAGFGVTVNYFASINSHVIPSIVGFDITVMQPIDTRPVLQSVIAAQVLQYLTQTGGVDFTHNLGLLEQFGITREFYRKNNYQIDYNYFVRNVDKFSSQRYHNGLSLSSLFQVGIMVTERRSLTTESTQIANCIVGPPIAWLQFILNTVPFIYSLYLYWCVDYSFMSNFVATVIYITFLFVHCRLVASSFRHYYLVLFLVVLELFYYFARSLPFCSAYEEAVNYRHFMDNINSDLTCYDHYGARVENGLENFFVRGRFAYFNNSFNCTSLANVAAQYSCLLNTKFLGNYEYFCVHESARCQTSLFDNLVSFYAFIPFLVSLLHSYIWFRVYYYDLFVNFDKLFMNSEHIKTESAISDSDLKFSRDVNRDVKRYTTLLAVLVRLPTFKDMHGDLLNFESLLGKFIDNPEYIMTQVDIDLYYSTLENIYDRFSRIINILSKLKGEPILQLAALTRAVDFNNQNFSDDELLAVVETITNVLPSRAHVTPEATYLMPDEIYNIFSGVMRQPEISSDMVNTLIDTLLHEFKNADNELKIRVHDSYNELSRVLDSLNVDDNLTTDDDSARQLKYFRTKLEQLFSIIKKYSKKFNNTVMQDRVSEAAKFSKLQTAKTNEELQKLKTLRLQQKKVDNIARVIFINCQRQIETEHYAKIHREDLRHSEFSGIQQNNM